MEILAAVVAALLLAGLGILGWLLVHVRNQQHRSEIRLDDLAHRVSLGAAVPAEQERDSLLNSLAGQLAPGFNLANLGGEQITHTSLLARAKPLLLVFTHPKCGPCYELLPDVGGWQRVYGDQLTIALISSGESQTNAAMTAEYGIGNVLLQHDAEVVDAYNLQQAPAAVVVNPDGRIAAGPRYGANAIRLLTAETLGMAMPTAPERAVATAGLGKPAPAIRRPGLAGDVVDLASFRGAPTLLLFWSPGCSHCQEILPDIKAFEQEPLRTRLLIVSRGPVGINQEVGFTSPVIIDDDQTIAHTFGAPGTPAALLIDSQGIVATQVARGSIGVRAALKASVISTAPALTAD